MTPDDRPPTEAAHHCLNGEVCRCSAQAAGDEVKSYLIGKHDLAVSEAASDGADATCRTCGSPVADNGLWIGTATIVSDLLALGYLPPTALATHDAQVAAAARREALLGAASAMRAWFDHPRLNGPECDWVADWLTALAGGASNPR